MPGPDSSSFGVNKKTVRFNSEDWSARSSLHPHYSAAAVAAGGAAGSSSRARAYFLQQHYPSASLHGHLSEFDLLAYEDDSWMTVEDVRSGRWARWEVLRQESQDSQTRDSGIETASCFTSSEDSNRGGTIQHDGLYFSKKVHLNILRLTTKTQATAI